MSWNTSQIFIESTEKSLKFIKESKPFSEDSYWVHSDFGNYNVDEREQLGRKNINLNLEKYGMLAIESMFGKYTISSKFFEDKFLPYEKEIELLNMDTFSQNNEEEAEIFPSKDFLCSLKNLANYLECNIAYYATDTWGGIFESEHAFFFGKKEEIYVAIDEQKVIKISEKYNKDFECLQIDILQEAITYVGGNGVSIKYERDRSKLFKNSE